MDNPEPVGQSKSSMTSRNSRQAPKRRLPVDGLNLQRQAAENVLRHKGLQQSKMANKPQFLNNEIELGPEDIETESIESPDKKSRPTLRDIHPDGFPARTVESDPMFPTSGKMPGFPGFGYDKDGVPLGIKYIEFVRNHLAAISDDDSSVREDESTARSTARAHGTLDQSHVGNTQRTAEKMKRFGDGSTTPYEIREWAAKWERRRVMIRNLDPELDI